MDENQDFLKYLIDEEIYIIEEKAAVNQGINPDVAVGKNITGSSDKESEGSLEVGIQTKDADGNAKKGDTIQSREKDMTSDASKSVDVEETAEAVGSVDMEETVDAGDALTEDHDAGGSISGDDKPHKKYKDATVLLLDFENQTSMPSEHKDLLAKILQSVNLDLDSVDMVFQNEFDDLEVKSFINCPVISFLQQIPNHISALFTAEKYMINIIHDNQFIACDTLNDLKEDRPLKRKLWEQLKLIYGI